MKTLGLNFHQTFKPERNCLNSLLMDLDECTGKTASEISKVTGIPTGVSSGKVVPTILYLEYMGLIKEQSANKSYQLEYTSLGESVKEEDPGLIENLTLLLLHCMISRKVSGAPLWSYIICELLPKYHGEISKANFDKELEMKFGKEVNISPFNGTYTGIFEQIDILSVSNNGYKMCGHPVNTEYMYVYAYILYEYWKEWASTFSEAEKEKCNISETEITSDQIAATGFRDPFGWSSKEEYQVLEALHDSGVIVLNRQMTPFTVRKVASREEIIDLLYSNLC